MSTLDITQLETIPVNRSELRAQQSALLRKAKGRTVLLVRAPSSGGEEKYVLDKKYFDEILNQLQSIAETLGITMDKRLFHQILSAAETLEEDLKSGKLHSLEEAFAED